MLFSNPSPKVIIDYTLVSNLQGVPILRNYYK